MKIAVASSGKWLDSTVDTHTGRAAFFVLYDTEREDYTVIDNWHCTKCLHWAGSRTANQLIEAGAEAVIVQKIGPCAFRRFSGAQIAVFFTNEASVVGAIKRFREDELPAAKEPNCEGHSHTQ